MSNTNLFSFAVNGEEATAALIYLLRDQGVRVELMRRSDVVILEDADWIFYLSDNGGELNLDRINDPFFFESIPYTFGDIAHPVSVLTMTIWLLDAMRGREIDYSRRDYPDQFPQGVAINCLPSGLMAEEDKAVLAEIQARHGINVNGEGEKEESDESELHRHDGELLGLAVADELQESDLWKIAYGEDTIAREAIATRADDSFPAPILNKLAYDPRNEVLIKLANNKSVNDAMRRTAQRNFTLNIITGRLDA